jgi:hypothetical protein
VKTTWLIALALCACERAKHDQTVELPMTNVTVHVIDAGLEPRAPLRYTGKGHGPIQFALTTRVTHDRGGSSPSKTTLFESTLELGSDGLFHEHQRGLDDKGTISDAWFDTRAVHVRRTLVRGPDVSDRVGSAERHIVFPDEPVGVGARWHEDITYGTSTATDDVELLARDGDHVREKITYHAESRSPKHDWPMHRDGTVIEDFELDGSDASMHQVDTYVMDNSDDEGTKGTATIDLVKR